jgi:hypothetical protein
LPAELRNKIFADALGGYDILFHAIHADYNSSTDIYTRVRSTIVPSNGEEKGFIKPTFQLPRVCRQLYAETALLPYTLNHFKFNEQWLYKQGGKYSGTGYTAMDVWIESRIPAQLKAIRSLEVPPRYWSSYTSCRRPAFKKRFPGLKKVVFHCQWMNNIFRRRKEEKVGYLEEGSKTEIEWLWDDRPRD